MRKILFIIILVSLFSPSLVEAKFRPKISIAGADFRSIPTYITEPVAFKKLKKKDLALKKKFFWRIKRSFSVCGVFGVHKTKLESEKGEGFIPSMIRYPKWQDQGIELLIKSGFARFGNKVKIEFRVYDVLQKAQLFNKKYTVKENRLNDAIYDLADKVYKLYTGVRSNLFSKLVYAKRNPNGHQLIFKSNIDGTREKPITRIKKKEESRLDILPAVSQDGKFVLFTSYVKHRQVLFEVDLFSGRVNIVSNKRGSNMGASYSPNRKKIALTLSKDGNSEIYIMDKPSGKIHRLTKNFSTDISPSFSPDGSKISFVSEQSGKPQIYIMDIDGGNKKRLSFQGDYNQTPAWSPDGRYIAFTARDERNIMDIFLMDSQKAGSSFIRLTQDQGNNQDPAFGPNGNQIVFRSSRNGRESLYIMNIDGSKQIRVTLGKGSYKSPAWSGWLK